MRNMKTAFLARAFAVLMLAGVPFSVKAHDAAHPVGVVQGQAAPDHLGAHVVALSNGLAIEDPTLVVAGPAAKSVAGFMAVRNASEAADRLIAVEADFARSAGLHTHVMEGDIAKMREAGDGFEIPAGGRRELLRGGDHIMLTGLKTVPAVGGTVNLTLTFEKAGSFTVPFAVVQAGFKSRNRR